MIPDIEEIIDGVRRGQYHREQALAWLRAHLALAENRGDEHALLDHYAAAIAGPIMAAAHRREEAESAAAIVMDRAGMLVRARGAFLKLTSKG